MTQHTSGPKSSAVQPINTQQKAADDLSLSLREQHISKQNTAQFAETLQKTQIHTDKEHKKQQLRAQAKQKKPKAATPAPKIETQASRELRERLHGQFVMQQLQSHISAKQEKEDDEEE
jgi:hypothetical protein